MFLSPLALQQHFLLTMCLVETLGTKCKVFIYIYPLYFVITYIGFIDTSIDHLQSFILVPCNYFSKQHLIEHSFPKKGHLLIALRLDRKWLLHIWSMLNTCHGKISTCSIISPLFLWQSKNTSLCPFQYHLFTYKMYCLQSCSSRECIWNTANLMLNNH